MKTLRFRNIKKNNDKQGCGSGSGFNDFVEPNLGFRSRIRIQGQENEV
jgi:hypothetical protein